MIDEFQDTSLMQYRFMSMMASRNVCIVGDDDQSIYSWRGANFENFGLFEKDFAGFKEVKLERNYRSTATILDAANAIIAHNENRKEKALWTPGGAGGAPIELYTPEDEGKEAEFIARTIKEIKLKDRTLWGEFGILIRTNNLTRRIEEALLAEQVPYRISGGTSFYGRKEIKDVISYLRVVANPDDDVNLLRIVNTPRRGIGKTSLEKLTAIARSHNASLRTAMELVRTGASLGAEGGGDAVEGSGGSSFGGLTEKAVADVSAFLGPGRRVPRGAAGQEAYRREDQAARRSHRLLGVPRRGEQAERQGGQVEVS